MIQEMMKQWRITTHGTAFTLNLSKVTSKLFGEEIVLLLFGDPLPAFFKKENQSFSLIREKLVISIDGLRMRHLPKYTAAQEG